MIKEYYEYVTISDVEKRAREIDEILLKNTELSEIERKSLEAEREDLLYYLQ